MTTETITYETVADKADIDAEAFEAFCDNQHISPEDSEEAVSDFQDAYIGYYNDPEDFIRDFLWDDLASIPEIITSHVNWDDVWACELRHDFYEVNGYYFRNI